MQFNFVNFQTLVTLFLRFLDYIVTIMGSSVSSVKDYIFNHGTLTSFNLMHIFSDTHNYLGFDLGLFGSILELIVDILNLPLSLFSLIFGTNLLDMPFLYYILIYVPLIIFIVGLITSLANFVLKLIRTLLV